MTFISRKKKGLSLEDCLNPNLNSKQYTDHLGKTFITQKEMCKYH